MDPQSLLSGVQYSELITITHVEERIRNNFQLIVDQLRRKHSQDQERDKQMASFRETIQQLLHRNLFRGQSKQKNMDRNVIVDGAVTVNGMHTAEREEGRQIKERNGFVSSNSQQNVEVVGGSQNSPEEAQVGLQNPELMSLNKEQQLDPQCKQQQQVLSYQEMEAQILSSAKVIRQLQQSQSAATDELKKLRQAVDTHTSNQSIHLQSQEELKQAIRSIQQLDKRIQSLEQLCEKNENATDLKLVQFDLTIRQKLSCFKEVTDQHNEKLTLFGQTIEKLQSRATQQRPPSSRNKLTLKTKIDPKIGQIEDRVNLLEDSNEYLIGSIRQLQLRIDNLESNDSRTPRTIEPVFEILQPETQETKTKLTDNILQKISDMRRQCLDLIKSLRKDMQNGLSKIPDFSSLGDSVKELRALISKKADEQGTKKMHGYLQSRVNTILQEVFRQEEDDARIGKTSWFCLSCDRGLKKFKGRIGEHIVADSLKGKKLEKQGREPSPLRNKSKSKVQLPKMDRNTEAFRK